MICIEITIGEKFIMYIIWMFISFVGTSSKTYDMKIEYCTNYNWQPSNIMSIHWEKNSVNAKSNLSRTNPSIHLTDISI